MLRHRPNHLVHAIRRDARRPHGVAPTTPLLSVLVAALWAGSACSASAPPKPVQDRPPAEASESPPPNAEVKPVPAPVIDHHSFSRPAEVRVTHMGLDWTLDFDARVVSGSATYAIDRRDPKAPLILDTRGLKVLRVETSALELKQEGEVPTLAGELGALTETEWTLGESDPLLGQALSITLPRETNFVRVHYQTEPSASGLQWLEPSQTAGKKHPFLYSQSQAIHARSWIPCQDSPGIRVTFDARVKVPEPYVAVMAAEMLNFDTPTKVDAPVSEGKPPPLREFRFSMPQRVPPYLLALAAGEIERAEIGSRTAVWAGPEVLEAARHEFADMEKMLESAEKLYGAYRWGRYDLLVLPPAFPFGGMENPRLTFATPTILAGDRSLVSLVAHELAHSWSGNLVTNATWDDLWLNEGFTVYFERRIVEALYGEERAEMEAALGKQELLAELADDLASKPDFQKLAIQLKGKDPDDNFSGIPYEKGALFLGALENAYGREVFDVFLRKWFDSHAFGSVTTNDFLTALRDDLLSKHEPLEGKAQPNVEAWVHGVGLPDDAPSFSAAAFDAVDAQVAAWTDGSTKTEALKTNTWTPHEWLHFLRALPEALTTEQMTSLDDRFALTTSKNSEILSQWLNIAARRRYQPAYSAIESFLVGVGRRKFLTPLYKALISSDEGKTQAMQIYAKARPGYHAISRDSLDELLKWDAG
jgi:aminopeptidase N